MFLYIKTNILRGYGIFKNDFAHPREPANNINKYFNKESLVTSRVTDASWLDTLTHSVFWVTTRRKTGQRIRAGNQPPRSLKFTQLFTEKAPIMSFSLLKVATTTFAYKTLLKTLC